MPPCITSRFGTIHGTNPVDVYFSLMKYSLPISPAYRSPIFEGLALQIPICIMAAMMLDFGQLAQISGMALVAFWGGVTVLIWRNPWSPSWMDIKLIRFGYFLVLILTGTVAPLVWSMRGFQI
jgi:hypothetical protein